MVIVYNYGRLAALTNIRLGKNTCHSHLLILKKKNLYSIDARTNCYLMVV
jgi:hypothetical protein